MFAKSVIESARFLRLTTDARLLYYDLGMAADDDGVVEAFGVMRRTGATEGALYELADAGFVVVLDDEDDIVYLSHWNRNNMIRRDRYHPSVHLALLETMGYGGSQLIG
jgi:hypothetical protein